MIRTFEVKLEEVLEGEGHWSLSKDGVEKAHGSYTLDEVFIDEPMCPKPRIEQLIYALVWEVKDEYEHIRLRKIQN